MWIPFVAEDINYLIQFDTDNIEFILSNLQHVWTAKFTTEELLQSFQNSNPNFQITSANSDNVIQQITEIMAQITENSADIKIAEGAENSLRLEYNTTISNRPISLVLDLIKGSTADFLKMITIPLIETVQYLEIREKKLRALLEKSSEELQNKFVKFEETCSIKKEPLFISTFTKCRSFMESFVNKFSRDNKTIEELEHVSVKRRKLKPYKKS